MVQFNTKLSPAHTVLLDSAEVVMVLNVPATPAMVKLVLEISKKMLPTASTFTRAVVVGLAGTVITSLPSLGVLAISVMG